MPAFRVRDERAEIELEAPNWLGALGRALPQLGLSPGALGRLVCAVAGDGSVEACDPSTNTRIRIEPLVAAPPPPLAMPTPGFEMRPPDPSFLESSMDEVFELEDGGGEEDSGGEENDFGAMDAARLEAGAVQSPGRPGHAAMDPRLEVVFERCAMIAAALDVRSACAAALTVLAELVPADAGCVLVRTRSGNSLRFAAAFGPRAQKVVDIAIPIDQGVAGFSHGFAMGVLVEDVGEDDRHYDRVDRASGYRTRSVLAVPLVGADGLSLGCMELLNSPTAFNPADLDVARAVAGSLAEWLAPTFS